MIETLISIIVCVIFTVIINLVFLRIRLKYIKEIENGLEEVSQMLIRESLDLQEQIIELKESKHHEYNCNCEKPTREVNDKSLWEPYCTNQ